MTVKNLNIDIRGLANRIIHNAFKKDILDITNMKIQKLLYYVYAEYYRQHNVLLFDMNELEFWKHGPVFPIIYYAFEKFGSNPIRKYILEYSYKDEEDLKPLDIEDDDNTEKIINVVNKVIDDLGNKTASKLRNMTHLTESVWRKIDQKSNGKIKMTEDYLPYMKKEAESIIG